MPTNAERIACLETLVEKVTTLAEDLRKRLDEHEHEEIVRRTRERSQKERVDRRDKIIFGLAGLALTAFNIAVQLWG